MERGFKMRNMKDKWQVYGEFGGSFTNLKHAKACAKEASNYDNECGKYASVTNIEDGLNYIDYENGKLTRDGWTIKK